MSDRPELLRTDGQNRPHCEDGPCCRWKDGTAIYAIHGVRVPKWVVERPDLIDVADIEKEKNVEVRRLMIERYKGGVRAYLQNSGAEAIHTSSGLATHGGRSWSRERVLWKKERLGDTPLVMVQVKNATPEPDGAFKDYWLRVPPHITDADEAVAWTFGQDKHAYTPQIES